MSADPAVSDVLRARIRMGLVNGERDYADLVNTYEGDPPRDAWDNCRIEAMLNALGPEVARALTITAAAERVARELVIRGDLGVARSDADALIRACADGGEP